MEVDPVNFRKLLARLPVAQLRDPRRYGASAAVVAFHLAAIWLLATNVLIPHVSRTGPDIELTLPSLRASVPASVTRMPEPEMAVTNPTIPEPLAPQIEIDTAPVTSGAAGTADILPPRPDPDTRNDSPKLPTGFAKGANTAEQVTLRILVDTQGAISDTRLAISSGQPVLDELAVAWVRAHWRFRAATQASQPVQDWTTVIVRFLP
jgi:TonB family protein